MKFQILDRPCKHHSCRYKADACNKTTDICYWKHFQSHQYTWPCRPLPVLHSCKQCTEHHQWSPCHDLSTDWVKKQQMAWDRNVDCPRVASSSSLFGLRGLLTARPLMMTVLRTSINCPTGRLLLDLLCKQIASNVFSSTSWFRFQVSSYLNFSFTLLHTCWTAAIVINHPDCEGGGWICSHSLLRKVQLFILLATFCQCS
jgi:hypothetical protein